MFFARILLGFAAAIALVLCARLFLALLFPGLAAIVVILIATKTFFAKNLCLLPARLFAPLEAIRCLSLAHFPPLLTRSLRRFARLLSLLTDIVSPLPSEKSVPQRANVLQFAPKTELPVAVLRRKGNRSVVTGNGTRFVYGRNIFPAAAIQNSQRTRSNLDM